MMKQTLCLIVLVALSTALAVEALAAVQSETVLPAQYGTANYTDLAVMPGSEATGPEPAGLNNPDGDLSVLNDFASVGSGMSNVCSADLGLAVGPDHVMTTTNAGMRIATRAGTSLLDMTLAGFWQQGLTIEDAYASRLEYDAQAERYYYVACAGRQSGSLLLFAVSQTSDPTGDWWFWSFDTEDPTEGSWNSQPGIGYTDGMVTLSVNRTSRMDDLILDVTIFAMDKDDVLAGMATPGTTKFSVVGEGATIVPCPTQDTGVSTQYLVNVRFAAMGQLQLFTITETGPGVFAFANLDTGANPQVDPWSNDLPDAPQLNGPEPIETNNSRVLSAIYRNGAIWVAHHIGLPFDPDDTGVVPDHVAVQWWQIDPVDGSVMDWEVVDDFSQNGLFYYYPSIAVNDAERVLLGFSGSSATSYVAAYYMVAGKDPVMIKNGEDVYEGLWCDGRNRWGNYSATTVDPADGQTFWTLQEYAESGGSSWGTWAAQIGVLPTPVISGWSSMLLIPEEIPEEEIPE